jgi:hypothetical protein
MMCRMLCWLTLLLLLVLTRNPSRPRLNFLDRAFWAWLSRFWSGWRIRLRFVQPNPVIR